MLPAWKNADACYTRAYRVLKERCAAEYKHRRGRYSPSGEVRALIDALARGDEARIKAAMFDITDTNQTWEEP